MAVTPVTALSETCLGVTTRLPPPGTTCTPVPPVSALCASLRAKAVIAEYTVCDAGAVCRTCSCRMHRLAWQPGQSAHWESAATMHQPSQVPS